MTDQYQSTNINGPRRTVTLAATASLNEDADLVVVNTTGLGAPPTITLPDAREVDGRTISIKVPVATAGSGGQNVVVDTVAAQTIDGAASVTIAIDQTALTVKSDNANWQIICLTDADSGSEIIFGDLFLDSASPTLTIGNGTGSPTLVLNKSDAGIATFDMNVAGITRWDWLFDAAEALSLERRDVAGVLVDVPISFSITNGTVTIPNALLLAGAAVGDAPATANSLVIGDGTATDFGITIFTTSEALFNVTDSAGGSDAGIRFGGGAGFPEITFRTADTDRLVIEAAAVRPDIASYDLGTTANRFDVGFIDQVLVAGASAADANVDADNLVIGTISAANFGITILSGAGNEGRLIFSDTAATEIAGFRYEHTSNTLFFLAGGADRMAVVGNAVLPAVTATQTLGSSSLRWGPSFINQISYDVQVAADGATIALGSSKLVQATAPTALTTLTLPAAVEGDEYFIDAVNITAGIAVTAAGGDTINGGVAGGTATISTLGLYHLYAVDGTDWRLNGPIALGPASA